MPTGNDWFKFLYVNLAFILFFIIIYYHSIIKDIQNNWPKYRCNPLYMALADDIDKNFQYCVQTSQSNFMGYLLQPLTFATRGVTDILGGATKDVNHIRMMFDKIRTFFSQTIQSVFGVFINLVIEFQRITLQTKDLVAKQIGVMTAFLYIMDGSISTMKSASSGPTGQLTKSLGKCFHPSTPVELKSGELIKMKNLKQGSILKDGSRVIATMKIDNKDEKPESLYKIKINCLKDIYVYVTGSHSIYDSQQGKFIKVKDYSGAELSKKKSKWFSCLITDSHKIMLGEKVFWDWEDYLISS